MLEKELLNIGAAYLRVSDERQDEYSPDSQLKKVREYAAREGYLIPDEYVFYDDGISGKSTKKRDKFNTMIALAKEKSKPFDKIYVWKFSRFARNQEESMVYKNLLRKKGITVVSVSEPIPDGAYGSLIERVIEWMDEFYLINLGTEVMRGMTEKASRGEPNCAPPFGYLMKDKKYYPDEESGASSIIQEIFTRYADGDGMRQIATDLNERGVKTQNGKLFDVRKIDYILHNPCYIGKIRWTPDGSRAVSKRKLDNESIMIVDGNHQPIISSELWEKCQARIETVKKSYSKYARKEQTIDHMLKGFIRCSACGSTLTLGGKSGKRQEYCLQCCGYSHGTCTTSHSIVLSKFETAFIEALENAVGAKDFNLVPSKSSKKEVSAVNYDKLIAVEERKLKRAKEAYLAEIDTLEQYSKNKADIVQRIEYLISKRDEEPNVKVNINDFAKKVDKIVKYIKRTNVSQKAKNDALHTIINKVIFDKPNHKIDIFFHLV